MTDEKAAVITLIAAGIPLTQEVNAFTTMERREYELAKLSRIYSSPDKCRIIKEEIVISPNGVYFVVIATCTE